jgi:hypothetical protein
MPAVGFVLFLRLSMAGEASTLLDEAQRPYDGTPVVIIGEFAPDQVGVVFEELLAGLEG